VDVHHVRLAYMSDRSAHAAQPADGFDVDDHRRGARGDEQWFERPVGAERHDPHVETLAIRVLEMLHHDRRPTADREIGEHVEHPGLWHARSVPRSFAASDVTSGEPAYAN
jgi:hypothetical protein